MSNIAPRSPRALTPRGMTPAMAQAYADLWRDHGITHELTISPADRADRFSRADLDETLKRLIRSATHRMRGVPKRKMDTLTTAHPDVLFIGGFHEDRRRSGDAFEHWHGGVALRPGEEVAFRMLLREHIGRDATATATSKKTQHTNRPISPNKSVPLSFHYAPMKTAPTYIAYANKHAADSEFDFSSTNDFIPYAPQNLN